MSKDNTEDIDLDLLLLIDQSDALDDRDAVLTQCKLLLLSTPCRNYPVDYPVYYNINYKSCVS